jgi:hypothetical protein
VAVGGAVMVLYLLLAILALGLVLFGASVRVVT